MGGPKPRRSKPGRTVIFAGFCSETHGGWAETQAFEAGSHLYFRRVLFGLVGWVGRNPDVRAGATATTSGLYLAAYKIALGDATSPAFLWLLPYLLWALSLVAFVLVLLPQSYATKENDPNSWRAAFLESGDRKYRRLMCGAVLFILGVLAGAYPFHS